MLKELPRSELEQTEEVRTFHREDKVRRETSFQGNGLLILGGRTEDLVGKKGKESRCPLLPFFQLPPLLQPPSDHIFDPTKRLESHTDPKSNKQPTTASVKAAPQGCGSQLLKASMIGTSSLGNSTAGARGETPVLPTLL